MKGTEVADTLKEEFKESVSDISFPRERVVRLSVPRELLHTVCKFLSDELHCEHVSVISAVDWPEHFECVYHIVSYLEEFMIELHVKVPKDDPKVDSVTDIWRGADYAEREAYDMMGITFEGHPNLVRILLPEDAAFFPLRKDFRG